jgi:hypothetical protein
MCLIINVAQSCVCTYTYRKNASDSRCCTCAFCKEFIYWQTWSSHNFVFCLPCKEGLTTFMTKIKIHNKYTFKALKHKTDTAFL